MKHRHRHEPTSGPRWFSCRRLFAGGLVLLAILACSAGIALHSQQETRQKTLDAGTKLVETTYVSRAKLEDALQADWPQEAVDWTMEQLADTDWEAEAAEAALDLGSDRTISEEALRQDLRKLEFTAGQAESALDKVRSGIDYDAHARSDLERCAGDHNGFITRPEGRSHLRQALFTEDQIRMALESDTVSWQKAARSHADRLLEEPVSRKALEASLTEAEFTEPEIDAALESLQPDFNENCRRYLEQTDPENRLSRTALQKVAQEKRFEQTQIDQELKSRDFTWNAVRFAGYLTDQQRAAMAAEDLGEELKAGGFTEKEQEFVLTWYDAATGRMPDEAGIREKIRQEEEARKKEEEEARKKAQEEEQRRAEEAARRAEEEAAAAQAPATSQSNAATVWIPRTGSKYHSNPNCSNMKNPSSVTLDQAIAWGYGRCKKCW